MSAQPSPRITPEAKPASGSLVTAVAGSAPTVTLRTLDLRQIRDGIGDEWGRRSQQVHTALQKDLKAALSGRGWFWPQSDNFYFLVFWSGHAAAIDETCRRIRAQLATHLKSLRIDYGNLHLPINGGHLDERGRFYIDRNESYEGAPPAEESPPPPVETTFAFEPVWNLRQGVVSAFRCIMVSQSARSRTIGETMTAEAEKIAQDAQADGEVLVHVVGEWSKLPPGAVCLLIVPVHYETLASSVARRRYLEVIGTMPDAIRKFLVFEITHLPEGVMAERLQDLTRYLKRFCRMTTALTSITADQFKAIAKAEIQIVSCIAEGSSEKRLFQLMDKYAEGASAHQLQAGIYGVKSPSLTTAAMGAGFVYVGGEAIRSLGDAPVGFFKFEMADVYRGGRGSAQRRKQHGEDTDRRRQR